jgi:LysM repeat protein
MLLALPQLVLASKTHVVRKSESLSSIARKYHVSVEELKSVNNLSGTHVEKGARVIIPSHPDALELKKKIAEKPKNYKVSRGDSLPRIARKTGLKVADIKRFNGLKSDRIKVGQVLALIDSSSAADPPRSDRSANRLQLVNRDLLNEQEFSETLAELTDIHSEQPVDLAVFVMEGMPGWTEDRIRRAMSDEDPLTVRLAEPVPVLIAYGTAMVKQGRVHFYDDVYGHDRRLDAALRRPRPAL